MDFFKINAIPSKKEGYVIRPDFQVAKSTEFMSRGHSFYAIWDEASGVWSTDEFVLRQIVDDELYAKYEELRPKTDQDIRVCYMCEYGSSSWKTYKSYINQLPDNYHQLNEKILFADEKSVKEDYISIKLPYCRDRNSTPTNYNILMETLYDPEERQKLEWAIGSIFKGDSKDIQKFIVLYGDAGSGKSTFLNILTMLFPGYSISFEAKQLGQSQAQFSMEQFKTNPLVAIQHDGDLSRIEDNTRLNSIISHEAMVMHEKYKSDYTIKLNTFLFMGTNSPVKITDAKSGIIRRLLDVTPSGRKLPAQEYNRVMSAIPFELGAIADHCIGVYEDLGITYYDQYTPISMMYKTNRFYNFVESCYSEFANAEYITLTRAFELYKKYCEDALEDGYRLTKSLFREELKNYFQEFHDRTRIGDQQLRSVYVGFRADKFEYAELKKDESDISQPSLILNCTKSILDDILSECPAQYANAQEVPTFAWDNVKTKLRDVYTTQLHYVRPPLNHIVIDFDLKDRSGEKSAKLNLIEAAKWPATYAEFSKGGNGVHLHYIYDGDVNKLSSVYSPGIEVKVFSGKSSLRRKLSYCNDIPVVHLSSGLPFKEDKKVVSFDRIKNEQAIRTLILRNLRKEYHGATKPSVDFIHKILEDAYNSGVVYDVRDLRPDIISFAARSTNHSEYCLGLVSKMQFKSEEDGMAEDPLKDSDFVFYDVESFPNVFIVCWKIMGEGHNVVKMINPKPNDIERLMRMKLIGYNSKKYDSHMIYGCYIGETPYQLYCRSQRLVSRDNNRQSSGYIKEAFNVDYVDVYDFAATKQSLKKWEIQLGIHHQENAYPWDEDLPEEHWDEVADYCANDVLATEAVFNHLQGDFIAREILADIAGMPVNTSTNTLTARIVFGTERRPKLIYTDLKTGEQS